MQIWSTTHFNLPAEWEFDGRPVCQDRVLFDSPAQEAPDAPAAIDIVPVSLEFKRFIDKKLGHVTFSAVGASSSFLCDDGAIKTSKESATGLRRVLA